MTDKPKFFAVLDPAIANELTCDSADISLPLTWKSNGRVWAVEDQYLAWHALRFPRNPEVSPK